MSINKEINSPKVWISQTEYRYKYKHEPGFTKNKSKKQVNKQKNINKKMLKTKSRKVCKSQKIFV